MTLLLSILVIPCYYFTKNDSYSNDEIYVVQASRETIIDMFKYWLNDDVHPPLYNLMLWLWIRIFGFSEYAKRALSTVCLAFGLGCFAYYSRKESMLRFVFSLIILATPIVFYYAIETRGYTLLYTISLITCLRFKQSKEIDWKQSVLLGLLGLTHFFGLVMAVCLSFSFLILQWKSKTLIRSHVFYAVLSNLPGIGHLSFLLLFGHLLEISGGNYYINTTSRDALNIIGNTLIPFVGNPYIFGVFSAILIIYFKIKVGSLLNIFSIALFLSLGGLLVLNFHTPLFSERYLLGFIPLFYAVVDDSFLDKPKQHPLLNYAAISVSICLSLLQLYNATNLLSLKISPISDYKKLAQYCMKYRKEFTLYYCLAPLESRRYPHYKLEKINNFYYRDYYGNLPGLMPAVIDTLSRIKRPFLLHCMEGTAQNMGAYIKELGIEHAEIVDFKSIQKNAYCVMIR